MKGFRYPNYRGVVVKGFWYPNYRGGVVKRLVSSQPLTGTSTTACCGKGFLVGPSLI